MVVNAFFAKHGVDPESWVLASCGLIDQGPSYNGYVVDPTGRVVYFFCNEADPDDEDTAWEEVSERPRDSRDPINMALLYLAERPGRDPDEP